MDSTNDSVTEAASVLAETPKDVVTLFSGESVEVRVCGARQLPDALVLISSVASDLGLVLSDDAGIQEKLLSRVSDVGFTLQLISKYANDVYSLVWRLTSLDTLDDVVNLPLDDLCRVVVKVIEVNRDFFIERVLPVFVNIKSL